jgi:hypothetical protein
MMNGDRLTNSLTSAFRKLSLDITVSQLIREKKERKTERTAVTAGDRRRGFYKMYTEGI